MPTRKRVGPWTAKDDGQDLQGGVGGRTERSRGVMGTSGRCAVTCKQSQKMKAREDGSGFTGIGGPIGGGGRKLKKVPSCSRWDVACPGYRGRKNAWVTIRTEGGEGR